jgi:hypothetical protein
LAELCGIFLLRGCDWLPQVWSGAGQAEAAVAAAVKTSKKAVFALERKSEADSAEAQRLTQRVRQVEKIEGGESETT